MVRTELDAQTNHERTHPPAAGEAATAPPGSFTLAAAAGGMAWFGAIVGAMAGYFVVKHGIVVAAGWCVAGAAVGWVAGAAFYVAVKILEVAIKALVFAVKVGFLLLVLYGLGVLFGVFPAPF